MIPTASPKNMSRSTCLKAAFFFFAYFVFIRSALCIIHLFFCVNARYCLLEPGHLATLVAAVETRGMFRAVAFLGGR